MLIAFKVYLPGLIIMSFCKCASKSNPDTPSLLKEGRLTSGLNFLVISLLSLRSNCLKILFVDTMQIYFVLLNFQFPYFYK